MAEFNRGKIKKPLSPAVQKYISSKSLAGDLDHSYQTYLDLNKSHVVMLAKQGIISSDVAAKILKVTQEMAAMGDKPAFELDPKLEDLYLNLEKYLIDRTGPEVGGRQHTARSRNDMGAAITRMDCRTFYFTVCQALNNFRRVMLDVAEKNVDAVMAAYTHLQPAEPITFGHYMAGLSLPFARDYARLSQIYPEMNLSPLGGGAIASTTWDIDCDMLSRLVGFDDTIDNSIDGVGGRDYCLAILAALTILGSNLSRLCTDLYTWAAPEFGYIEVDDSVAICSSIMPQKKNPYTFEYVRGRCGNILGSFVGSYSDLKNTPYTNVCDVISEAPKHVFTALKEMEGCLNVMSDTLETMNTNKERMLEAAKGNFCSVTELANALVRKGAVSFRTAHHVVAELVDLMLRNHKRATDITLEDVDRVFSEVEGRASGLTEDDIHKALDPVRNTMSKTIPGGTAPEEVRRQIAKLRLLLEKDEAELALRMSKISEAKAELEKEVEALIASE